MTATTLASSFRDPAGFVFQQDGILYRQINHVYKDDYNHLVDSGLYQSLIAAGLLIPHEESGSTCARSAEAYTVIRPEAVGFVSYPYEWCFSQLKDAALTTLKIQAAALDFGMSLKDCSAYNIQFWKGKPLLIDTLSFERYREGEPWVAYRQFCQHFLTPLALMSYTDVRLNQLLRVHLDGVPLDLARKLLPSRARLSFPLLLHVYLHARSERRARDAYKAAVAKAKLRTFNLRSFRGLLDNLETAVAGVTWSPEKTVWASYYEDQPSYAVEATEEKKRLVGEFVEVLRPKVVWDLGANTGVFSRIASDRAIPTVSYDMDPSCVELNYRTVVAKREKNILPLVLDLTNPSPGIGWENQERMTIAARGPADTVIALALIHHLAIVNNLPFSRIAAFLDNICRSLIIEFVPKTDPMVQQLLATRADVFPRYTKEDFERAFDRFFVIHNVEKISGSERILYLMRRK